MPEADMCQLILHLVSGKLENNWRDLCFIVGQPQEARVNAGPKQRFVFVVLRRPRRMSCGAAQIGSAIFIASRALPADFVSPLTRLPDVLLRMLPYLRTRNCPDRTDELLKVTRHAQSRVDVRLAM
jgi:hypothetical protein